MTFIIKWATRLLIGEYDVHILREMIMNLYIRSRRVLWIFLLSLSSIFALSACSESMDENMQMDNGMETAVDHAEKHMDPTYVCPMHPTVTSDKPGTCNICGMNLVKKKAPPAQSKVIKFYKHPHNPSVISDKPMKDEMGMDYLPVYEVSDEGVVRISPAVVNNLGVRTEVAEYSRLWRRIDTVGYVDLDEDKISHIHLRTEGWIEKLYVTSEGERVKKGEPLFELYSPELVTAQDEYVQALATKNKRLAIASENRLLSLGISKGQIKALRKTRNAKQFVVFYAPQDGIVDKLSVREGMFVIPNVEIMSLADLSSVWIQAEVFEKQADWVKLGQNADVKLSYLPGREWNGKVEFIYPSLNEKTRTLRVRLRFENKDESLKPNMFAQVSIYVGPKYGIIVIPREAVIRTGKEDRVLIALGEGKFKAQTITVGIESGKWVEVIKGLNDGDRVVTSGQFLIDSEASIQATIARMNTPDKEMDMGTSMKEGVKATGVIKEIKAGENVLNIAHDPIAELKWPSMVMDINVMPEVSLEGLKVGDSIDFELKETSDDYVIQSIQVKSEEE